jgi:hypothetical protein
MDQAKPEDQVVPRLQQECSLEADMGSDVLLFAAELHQIPDQIQRNPSGAHPHDCFGAHGTATHHRYSLVQRPVNQKTKRAGYSTRSFLTG